MKISRQTLFVNLILLGLVLLVYLLGGFEFVELKARDAAFALRGARPPESPIVIVAIDDESFSETGMQWPWSRSSLAQLVDRLALGRPKVVALDLLLYEAAPGDNVLADALARSGNVILANNIVVVNDPGYHLEQLNQPVDLLMTSAAGTGLANFPRDADGYVRRVLAFQVLNGQRYYHLAVTTAARYLGESLSSQPGIPVLVGGSAVPLVNQSLLLDFQGPARTYKTISAYQVLNGDVKPEYFQDKIVLIGATAESLHDNYPTPFRGDLTPMPGVEINANAIDTLLNARYLTQIGTPVGVILILLASAVGFGLSRIPRVGLALAVLGALMSAYIVLWVIAFIAARIQLVLIAPEAVLFLALVAPSMERAIGEEAEKRRVRGIFERFVAPQVVDELVARGLTGAYGRRAELTILFSDVRNFTTLSEKLSPDQVVQILNEYLEAMAEVIFRHRGTIDKYEGDAIIAFWGAPAPDPDHAAHAVHAALDMRIELERLRVRWSAGLIPQTIEIGIGVNSGDVFVGLIGSSKRVNYTVIGDNVNLAARLQDLTKECNWPILISDRTLALVGDEFEVKFFDTRQVRGKTDPVKIYKVLGVTARAEGVQ